jgi:tetratricopeptide (TPR) repeat protein
MRAIVIAAMAASGLASSGLLEAATPALSAYATVASARPSLTRPTVTQVEFYQEGNRLYQDGDFEGALASYLRLVEAGFESGEVYYNIGNTYFKLGDIAQAILYYERARRLLPGDEDVQANLDLARSLTVDEIEPLPRFWLFSVVDWWVDLLPRTLLIAVVTVSYLVGTGVVLLLILKRGVQVAAWGGRIAVVSAVVFALFGLNLAVREFDLGRAQEAVVLQLQVDVMSAPLDDETLTVFTVHEGTKVRIDRLSEEWAEVVLEDGRVGWVPVGVLETI